MTHEGLSARVKALGLPGGVRQVADAVERSTVTIHGWANAGDPLAEAAIDYALKIQRTERAVEAVLEAQRLLPDEQVSYEIAGDLVSLSAAGPSGPPVSRTQPVDLAVPFRLARWFAATVNTERKRHAAARR